MELERGSKVLHKLHRREDRIGKQEEKAER